LDCGEELGRCKVKTLSKETVQCVCGCVILQVYKSTDNDIDNIPVFTLDVYESSFMGRQGKLKQYFNRLLNSIIGKDYFLWEVVLSEDDYKKLVSLKDGDK
jgi:hypothetical protein